MQPHKVVSHDEWLAARKAHLADEKAFTRSRDALSRKRRELPWEKIEKNYVFDTPGGKQSLADLFGGKSQLIVYHFMLGPDWEQGCPSCSLLADHFDGAVVHLAQRDVVKDQAVRSDLDALADHHVGRVDQAQPGADARTATPGTPAARPRHPACAAATTRVRRSAISSGTQSAV